MPTPIDKLFSILSCSRRDGALRSFARCEYELPVKVVDWLCCSLLFPNKGNPPTNPTTTQAIYHHRWSNHNKRILQTNLLFSNIENLFVVKNICIQQTPSPAGPACCWGACPAACRTAPWSRALSPVHPTTRQPPVQFKRDVYPQLCTPTAVLSPVEVEVFAEFQS